MFGSVKGEALVRSEQVETFAKVKILSVDKQNQRAVFEVEAILLNFDTGKLNKLDRTKVIVKGEHFLRLLD